MSQINILSPTVFFFFCVLLSMYKEGDSKASFSIATTQMCRQERYSFAELLHFTLDPYLIMLSVKQGGIKYYFWVCGMTRPGIEPWSHGSLANILTIFIILTIMSCRQHGFPWPSLAISPYRSSPLVGLQGYNPYPYRAAVCMFELVVLLLLGHMWVIHRSISLMSSSLLLQPCPACLVRLTWIVFVMGGRWP